MAAFPATPVSTVSTVSSPMTPVGSVGPMVFQPRSQNLAIDLGEDQRAAVQALMEARQARRARYPDDASFLSRASSLFSGGRQTDLCAVVDRATNLSKLARSGVLPADIVQTPGMSYKRLANAYSIPALVDYGFTWSHLLQLGIDVDDLHSVTSDEFRLLRVTAQELLRDLPLTGEDLVSMKLKPHVLRELKFNFDHFLALKLKTEQLCGSAGMMSVDDLHTYFQPTQSQLSSMDAESHTVRLAHSAHSAHSARSAHSAHSTRAANALSKNRGREGTLSF